MIALNAGLSQSNNPPSLLIGKWTWQETRYTLRGMRQPVVISPAVIDTTMEVVFNSNQLMLYKNGHFYGSFSYHISDYEDGSKMLNIAYMGFNDALKVDHGPLLISENTMSIAGGYDDAGGEQFFTKVE